MDVHSLGYQTDLALLRLGGSEISDAGDHLVIRSPRTPDFWWGNFLLLQGIPPDLEVEAWRARFVDEFPGARHTAFGFDGTRGTADDLAGWRGPGVGIEASAVMTATEVHEPPRPNRGANYRAFACDDDWAQSVELRCACDDTEEPEAHRIFAESRVAVNRPLTEAGHGAWFGAFVGGRLESQMGMLAAGNGLGRFQSVETRPSARGQGLAGTLVHTTAQFGFETLGATTLVMVADPDYLAIRVYESVGFARTETQLQVEGRPTS